MSGDDTRRLVRSYFAMAESALDGTLLALSRIDEPLDGAGGGWREEFLQDIDVFEARIRDLRASLSGSLAAPLIQ